MTLLLLNAKFPVGQVVTTQGALEALRQSEQSPLEFLQRHASGDWGEMDEGDRQENEYALHKPLRLFSAYHTNLGEKLWVITEADRSATTFLLPAEY